jgi:putative acetyltransferase
MPQFSVRSERGPDVEAIDAVTRQAFANHPFSNQTEHLIVLALRNAGALTVSLVAETQGEVIGHVAASPVQIAGQSLGWFGLGPVSVATARQGHGVGSALVRAALAELQAVAAAGCVLLGNPVFYRRFGFVQNPSLASPARGQSISWPWPGCHLCRPERFPTMLRSALWPNPSVKGTSRKRAAPYVER